MNIDNFWAFFWALMAADVVVLAVIAVVFVAWKGVKAIRRFIMNFRKGL
jgi:uncharacterized membrane protein YqjE